MVRGVCALGLAVLGLLFGCGDDSTKKSGHQLSQIVGTPGEIERSVDSQSSPAIKSLSPAAGDAGSVVAIYGTGFGSAQGLSNVAFGGLASVATSWSDTRIEALVPAALDYGTVEVVVAVGGKISAPAHFTVTGVPPVVAENAKPGDTDWPILNPGDTAAYAVPEAVRAGETVALHVHTGVAGTASYRLYRMGFYGGAGARLIATGTFEAGPQPMPLADTATGMVECAWPASATIQTGEDWPSGYYLAKVKGANGTEHFAPFTLMGGRRPRILVAIPTATYQAYNFWGGASLYINQNKARFPNHDHAVTVSYHRPYITDGGAGQFLRLDHAAVKWLEAAGFDVGYVSNVYVAAHPEVLQGSALYLSIGHDEYWPHALRAALEAARDRGMHLVFWSGNTGLWQTRIEPSGTNVLGRQVGYKEYWPEDPLVATQPSKVTGQFREHPVNRPENALLGIMWDCCGISPSSWLPLPTNASIWENTGFTAGSSVVRAVTGEYDRRWDNGQEPAGLEILAESPVAGATSLLEYAHTSRYRAPSGAWVYAMGSIGWQEALGKPGAADADFQTFNANVLALADKPRGEVHPANITQRTVYDSPQWLATTVHTVAGSGAAGFVNGGSSFASFNEPRDVALRPGGGLYVADGRNGAIRLIAGGTVSTVVSGLGFPNGVTVTPDGMVYVSDPWRHMIWEVDPVFKTKRALAGGLTAYQDGVGAGVGFANLNPVIASPAENVLYALDLPFGVRKIARDGTVTTAYATELQGWGLVRTVDGFYASHPDTLRIYGLGVPNLAGNGEYGVKDGAAGSAAFTGPASMIGTSDGSVFVVDTSAGTIRRIQGGQVVSVAGTGHGYQDGAGSTAKFRVAMGMAYDPINRQLFVADAGNHVIRMVQLP